MIVAHQPAPASAVVRLTDLQPDTTHHIGDRVVRTLARPDGELLCRIATVNDLHFGEVECGKLDDDPRGPIQRVVPGEPPYPETMNHGGIAEMLAAALSAAICQGALTDNGADAKFTAFVA